MKIAVCLFGQPRFFSKGLESLKNAFSKFDVDYFTHLWFDPENLTFDNKNSVGSIDTFTFSENTAEEIISLINPKKYIFEKQKVFVPELDYDSRSKTHMPAKNFMSVLYSTKQVGKLLSKHIEETSEKYDFVFFTRTDIFLSPNNDLYETIKSIGSDHLLTHYCQGDMWNIDHINDGFVGSDNVDFMIHYSKLFDNFKQYWLAGQYLCLHRMKFYHMNLLDNIRYKQVLRNQWWFIRNGGLVDTYGKFTKI